MWKRLLLSDVGTANEMQEPQPCDPAENKQTGRDTIHQGYSICDCNFPNPAQLSHRTYSTFKLE